MRNIALVLALLAMVGTASAALVGEYKFEGSYNDTSGYGTAVDGTTVGNVALVVDATRGNVLSIRHDATGDGMPESYLKIADNDKFDFTNAMTMMAWVKEPEYDQSLDSTWSRIIVKEGAYEMRGAGDDGFQVKAFTLNSASQLTPYSSNGDWIMGDTWTHIAMVFDSNGATIKGYINGEEKLSATSVLAHGENLKATDAPILFGQAWGSVTENGGTPGEYNWRGLMDDVLLFNTALSEASICNYMTTGIPEPATLALLGLGGLLLRRRK